MKLRGLVSNFDIYVSVSNLYIPRIGLFGYSKMGKPVDINRSQIHECGNWETEHYNSVLEIARPLSLISGNTSIGTRHLYWPPDKTFKLVPS
jgi:hypothetical protein